MLLSDSRKKSEPKKLPQLTSNLNLKPKMRRNWTCWADRKVRLFLSLLSGRAEREWFLDATKYLYKRVCPSVGPSVRPLAFSFQIRKSQLSERPPKVASGVEYSALLLRVSSHIEATVPTNNKNRYTFKYLKSLIADQLPIQVNVLTNARCPIVAVTLFRWPIFSSTYATTNRKGVGRQRRRLGMYARLTYPTPHRMYHFFSSSHHGLVQFLISLQPHLCGVVSCLMCERGATLKRRQLKPCCQKTRPDTRPTDATGGGRSPYQGLSFKLNLY